VVPPIVKRAASVLVTGSLARESMLAQGADPERIRVFANTVDVVRYGERADELAPRRDEIRAAFGFFPENVAVLTVARLAPEKGIDVLLRAVARAGLAALVVGEGPERSRLEQLARELEVEATFTARPWEQVVEAYVAADVFVLLSAHAP